MTKHSTMWVLFSIEMVTVAVMGGWVVVQRQAPPADRSEVVAGQKRLAAVQERLAAAEAGLSSCQEALVAQGIAERAAQLPHVGARRTEVFCLNDTTLRLTHEYFGATHGWSERLEKVDDAPHDLTAGCWQIEVTP